MPKEVLIVDDAPAYGRYLSALLRRHGYRAHYVTSAAAALQLIETIHFDAVITDIYMPERDGIELLRQIRVLRRDLPVLGITGDASELLVVVDRAFRAMGGVKILTKPIRIAELLALLDSATAGSDPAQGRCGTL